MDYQQLITFIMEMVGTIAFAASGAMVAVDRAMDIFGVIVLGVTTAVGGGAVRDVILGIVPPAMFQHPVYTVVATVTSCVVFMILYLKKELLQGHNRETYDKVMLVMDSIGLGIFTVVGVNTGIAHGYMDYTFLLVFLGTVTGVGGGLLRDVMAGAVYPGAPYLCMRVYRRSNRLCGTVPEFWGSRSDGGSLSGGNTDPLSSSALPVEFAKTYKRRIKDDRKAALLHRKKSCFCLEENLLILPGESYSSG